MLEWLPVFKGIEFCGCLFHFPCCQINAFCFLVYQDIERFQEIHSFHAVSTLTVIWKMDGCFYDYFSCLLLEYQYVWQLSARRVQGLMFHGWYSENWQEKLALEDLNHSLFSTTLVASCSLLETREIKATHSTLPFSFQCELTPVCGMVLPTGGVGLSSTFYSIQKLCQKQASKFVS